MNLSGPKAPPPPPPRPPIGPQINFFYSTASQKQRSSCCLLLIEALICVFPNIHPRLKQSQRIPDAVGLVFFLLFFLLKPFSGSFLEQKIIQSSVLRQRTEKQRDQTDSGRHSQLIHVNLLIFGVTAVR